jgi:stearoyl-CoA desaturase (delta-9 desaturase)
MTLHRYYSHKSFEFKNILLKWIFTILAILTGRGSPLGWVYLHRKHHAYSDTNQDPHSPKYLGYKLFGFSHYKKQEEEKMQLFLVKDLVTKEQLFIHKWYMLIMLVFIVSFALINIELFYFVWVIPAFLIQISQYNFNYFGHMFGYRNFDTKDDSRNNIWLFPIILGETWHNNHHTNPKNMSTTVRKFEIDPLHWFIKLIKK